MQSCCAAVTTAWSKQAECSVRERVMYVVLYVLVLVLIACAVVLVLDWP